MSWPVTLPGDSASRVNTLVAANRDKVLFPNAYGNLDVQSGAKLYLGEGSSYFHSVNIHSNAQLILQSMGGLVRIYADTAFTFDGTVSGLGGNPAQLLVGYFGTGQAHVAGTFKGTFAGPTAAVDIGGTGFSGSLFAKPIQVASNAKLTFQTAPWDLITGRPTTAPTPLKMPRAPALLTAVNQHKPTESYTVGTASPSSTVSFVVPARLPVSEGNAGNLLATLSFTTGTTKVTCTYKGGASTAHPTEQLDVARAWSTCFKVVRTT